jgi:hypothetical protein
MTTIPEDGPVKHTRLPCSAYGWLRRPEFDSETADVWELPDGKLRAVPRGMTPIIIGKIDR